MLQSQVTLTRVGIRTASILVLLAGIVAAAAPAGADSIAWDGQNLSLETSADQPLRTILRRVSTATGLPIGLRGDLGTLPPVRIEAVPLDRALRLLAGTRNVVLRWADLGTGEARIESASVLASGGSGGRYVHPDPRAEVVRTDLAQGPAEPISAVRSLLHRAGPETLPDLARIASTHPDPVARELAVRGLARVEGDVAFEALAAALTDRDPTVRLRAARNLSLRGGERAKAVLAAARPVERDPRIAHQLERFLARFG